jgi:hypothetical protein
MNCGKAVGNPKRPIIDRQPIEFRQLCGIVRTLMEADPSIGYTELKEQTIARLRDWGFETPSTTASIDMLTRAMYVVESSVYKTLGPRPVPVTNAPEPKPVEPIIFEGRKHLPAGWDLVQALILKMQRERPVVQPEAGPPPPAEIVGITEGAALVEFRRRADQRPEDRIPLLRALAEIAIVRPDTWDVHQVRAAAEQGMWQPDDRCFACFSGRSGRAVHHVIQVQHGGSNHPWNRVTLCPICHAQVHPWLMAEVSRRLDGFVSLGQIYNDADRKRRG